MMKRQTGDRPESGPAREHAGQEGRWRSWLQARSWGRLLLGIFRVKMIRFFLVAGLNTAFGYGVFSLFIFLGLHYTLAALLGQIIGILFNFRTYGVLVFKNKELNLLPRFILIYAITYLCNIGSMTLLKYYMGVNDYVASAIVCIPIGILGFVLNKAFVFERIRWSRKQTRNDRA